ncbi:HotDog domain-containing protein [Hygrophoropsis aurantiaca]|uniref:HotDog domain-containing protein n=1 Tax=Hygrophoropsis aurantiaca TaxID=72124 RepID=A0ACB7ZV75_9AGAM|nr:HotDog domain-containing protein [Hygrophoropsis aurantiaca]
MYDFPSGPLNSLQAAFKDPSSPFHLAPGTAGPASPDEVPDNSSSTVGSKAQPQPVHSSLTKLSNDAATEARAKLIDRGYDASSLWEQSIVWGHHDAFQHVNNAHYLRFFESGRMEYLIAVGNALGGPERARAMLSGKGVSFILKSISVNFRRPVVYPDTLLIGHKAVLPESNPSASTPTKSSRTSFRLSAVAYSYAQRAIVADSDSVIVWYDYDKLTKCDPGERAWMVLRDRVGEKTD